MFTKSLYVYSCFLKLFEPAKPLELLDFETCLKVKRLHLLLGQNLYMLIKIL